VVDEDREPLGGLRRLRSCEQRDVLQLVRYGAHDDGDGARHPACPGADSIGLCVASGCEFLAPIGFPETVDVGVRVGRIGNSSIRYELAIFPQGQQPAAVCHFTHVYVDGQTRTGVALTAGQKAAIADLVR
jgi:hypothetical protein